MSAFSKDHLEALMREMSRPYRSDGTFRFGADMASGRDESVSFIFRDPPPPPRKPSKFDGPDVLDMVLGADGVWALPAHLEHRARAL